MKPLAFALALLILISCSNSKIYKPDVFADEVCDCFVKQTSGSIDSRLDPCLTKPMNENFTDIHNDYYPELHRDTALKVYLMDITLALIDRCDKFYQETDSMYTNSFSQVEPESVKNRLSALKDSLNDKNATDSAKVSLLNKRIHLFTKARMFDEALVDIKILDSVHHRPEDTYFVKAYIFRGKGQYERAIEEIEWSIKQGNNDSRIIRALIMRKQSE